jgi:hypothetical protein
LGTADNTRALENTRAKGARATKKREKARTELDPHPACFVTVRRPSGNSYFFGLPYRKKMKTVFNKLTIRPMKAAITILSLLVAICLGLLAYQQHTYSTLFERQNQAIALVQRQYETSLRENQALRAKGEIQARSQIALSQAQPIAVRYRKIFEAQKRATR